MPALPGFFRFLLAALVVIGAAPACFAVLKTNDAAPPLQVGQWLQGDAVTSFEGDKVYLVEFWATWCGPCKASIPHLNDLHQRFKDKGLVVIGQNVWEKDPSLVAPFVKGMAGKMNYRVATDNNSAGGGGFMAQNWLVAAEQKGIPCAFVINKKGRIVFIGHPMSLKQEEVQNWLAEPSTAASPLVKPRPADATPSAQAQDLIRRAEAAIRAGDWDQAETAVAELDETLSENFRDIGGLLNLDLLLARQQSADALQLAKLLCEDFKGNSAVLNAVASRLAHQPGANASVLAAAEKIVTPISASAGAAQFTALATLARIAHLRGERPRAVDYQTRAVALAPENATVRQQALLDTYKQQDCPPK